MELQRGRLIDHIQLVVADIGASRRFYEAVFEDFYGNLWDLAQPANSREESPSTGPT